MQTSEEAARKWFYSAESHDAVETLAALISTREEAAYREGAEAMRERAAKAADEADGLDPQSVYGIAEDIRALPIPERKR